jgi:hypothetical protein
MQQSWKADMMSALGESASFGRFLSEPLDWGKWSAFEHNRYLEEAVHQARPGSVAQKKAMLEAHYARKSNTEADAEGAEGGQEGGDASLSPSTEGGSSCMTDDAAPEQEVSGGGDPQGALECDGAAGLAAEEVHAITDSVALACRMDGAAADEICNREERDALQSQEKHDSSNGHLVSVDAADERQPLKVTAERSVKTHFCVQFSYWRNSNPRVMCVSCRNVPLLTRTRTSRILPTKGGFRCRLCFKSRPNSTLPPRVKSGSPHLQKGDQLRIHQRRTPHPPARIVASGPQPPSQKRGLHWHRCTCP